MVNEETDIYRVYVDTKPKCPTLRIEWKIKTDPLPKFIEKLEDWQQRKVYDHMREYVLSSQSKSNKIHEYYILYNNRKGIKELKQLI